jgi:hypothetical protein
MIEIPEEIKNKKFTLSGAMLIFIILLAVGAFFIYDDYTDFKKETKEEISKKSEKDQLERIFKLLSQQDMNDKEIRYNLKKVLLKEGLPYTEIGTPEIIIDTIKGEK